MNFLKKGGSVIALWALATCGAEESEAGRCFVGIRPVESVSQELWVATRSKEEYEAGYEKPPATAIVPERLQLWDLTKLARESGVLAEGSRTTIFYEADSRRLMVEGQWEDHLRLEPSLERMRPAQIGGCNWNFLPEISK